MWGYFVKIDKSSVLEILKKVKKYQCVVVGNKKILFQLTMFVIKNIIPTMCSYVSCLEVEILQNRQQNRHRIDKISVGGYLDKIDKISV